MQLLETPARRDNTPRLAPPLNGEPRNETDTLGLNEVIPKKRIPTRKQMLRCMKQPQQRNQKPHPTWSKYSPRSLKRFIESFGCQSHQLEEVLLIPYADTPFTDV